MSDVQDEAARAYMLTRDQAMTLSGTQGMPLDLKRHILAHYAKTNGTKALVDLFAQFMGLANSVVDNNREAIEIFAIAGGSMHPDAAEKINLPTIFGACNGAMVAEGINQDDLCYGCAFRHGALANQSAVTTCDADYCSHLGETPFMCHERLDENDQPTRPCAGFVQLRQRRKRASAGEMQEGNNGG